MDKAEQKSLAATIKEHLQETSASLDGEFIVIGGWAVHAWGKRDYSLDGDAMVSFEALGILRDEFVVTPLPRMHRQQYQMRGFDIDLYVEQQHRLPVPFDELRLKAAQKEGMWVACPEHLLVLKLAAYKGRGATPKGEKDRHDLVALVEVIRKKDNIHCEVISKYVEEEESKILNDILNDKNLFIDLSNGNGFKAKDKRAKAKKDWEDIYELCQLQQEGPGI